MSDNKGKQSTRFAVKNLANGTMFYSDTGRGWTSYDKAYGRAKSAGHSLIGGQFQQFAVVAIRETISQEVIAEIPV